MQFKLKSGTCNGFRKFPFFLCLIMVAAFLCGTNVQAALKMNPGLKEIGVIRDNTESGYSTWDLTEFRQRMDKKAKQ